MAGEEGESGIFHSNHPMYVLHTSGNSHFITFCPPLLYCISTPLPCFLKSNLDDFSKYNCLKHWLKNKYTHTQTDTATINKHETELV